MNALILRKVKGHPQVTNAYRIVYGGVEVGSIGLRHHAGQREEWHWGIDTVLPPQAFPTAGEACCREDAMAQFSAVWAIFSSDPHRLADFLAEKRKRI